MVNLQKMLSLFASNALPTEPANVSWPVLRMGEAMEMLAHLSKLDPRAAKIQTLFTDFEQKDYDELEHHIEKGADYLGIEAEPLEMHYADVEQLISIIGPALILLPESQEGNFIAVLGGRTRQTITVLGPDLKTHILKRERLTEAICKPIEAPLIGEIDQLLEEAGIAKKNRLVAKKSILKERLRDTKIAGCWLLRPSPASSFWRQIRTARLLNHLYLFIGSHTIYNLLWLLSWWVIGRTALQGRLDYGWLFAWGLLLLTMWPFRILTTWSQAVLTIKAGGLLKQRLLCGALKLMPEEIRHQGAGQLLGKVLENEAVESSSLNGGYLGIIANIELILAFAILTQGVSGWSLALLLLAWTTLAFFIAWRYLRNRKNWTESRMQLTHDLVEKMVGHRTRLAQQSSKQWHEDEDEAHLRYLHLSEIMDKTSVFFKAVIPRGWLILALLGLSPAFIFNQVSTGALAVTIGGIIFAYRALNKLTTGLLHITGAIIGWNQVSQLFHAASRAETPGESQLNIRNSTDDSNNQTILEAHDLLFRYNDKLQPVLEKCDLSVFRNDKVLVEGASGEGKSTLVSLLTGIRNPQSGVILLQGLDRETWGSGQWRRQVVAVPQFYENHVLSDSLAFNLLMGRRWPPRRQELDEAEAICRELGLGDLLDRMPAGLMQIVGENGWQLSNGEKSRLYIARALLQEPDILVLDESFTALDPDNQQQVYECVCAHAPTIIVMAHI